MRSLVRQLVLGAVMATLLSLSLLSGVSADGGTVSDNDFVVVGCPVGNYDCYYARVGGVPYAGVPYAGIPYGGYGTPYGGAQFGRFYYRDNRYCGDGLLFIQNGINYCANSGVRVYPIFPDFGYGYGGGVPFGYPYYR